MGDDKKSPEEILADIESYKKIDALGHGQHAQHDF